MCRPRQGAGGFYTSQPAAASQALLTAGAQGPSIDTHNTSKLAALAGASPSAALSEVRAPSCSAARDSASPRNLVKDLWPEL